MVIKLKAKQLKRLKIDKSIYSKETALTDPDDFRWCVSDGDHTFDTVNISGSGSNWSIFTGSDRGGFTGSDSSSGGDSGDGTSNGGQYGGASSGGGTGEQAGTDVARLTAREIEELASAIVGDPLITIESTDDCGEGYYVDRNGKCVKVPCKGDPITNPEIASSGLSGKKGGTFGCTRKDITTCGGVYGKRNHNGLDIKASVNENAFAMYDGTVSIIRDTFAPGEYKKGSYGNFVVITAVIDGVTHNLKYNHLNTVSVIKGQKIKVGEIIGLTGNTGNAADPIVIPHIHLQVFNSNWTQSLNPEEFLKTKFDSNYNPIPNNCQ
jgi:murein DD-endopeptidase MepM/ murein hydrolase activator NlpD